MDLGYSMCERLKNVKDDTIRGSGSSLRSLHLHGGIEAEVRFHSFDAVAVRNRKRLAGRHSWIFSRRVWPRGSIDIKCLDRTNNLIDPLSPKAIIGASARLLADVRGRHDDARFYEWFQKDFVPHDGSACRLFGGNRRCDGWLALPARMGRGGAAIVLSLYQLRRGLRLA